MRYKIYTTSKKAWDAMIEAIDQAQKSIYIEMYIFSSNTARTHDFIGKLKQKARLGVRVILIADAFGSSELSRDVVQQLRLAGVEFLFFSNWLRHVHRKVLIVDEKTAFIGGVNIAKEFSKWNDLQIRLHGKIVKKILQSFAYTYEMSGGKNKRILSIREKNFSRKFKEMVVEHWPIKNVYSMKSHYVEKITNAKKSIKIITPYFTPPRWLVSLLEGAIRRGVRVEILVPKEVDWEIFTSLNYRFMHKLHFMGIKFYLTNKMNHAKLLIIDDQEGLIGSQNIDPISFGYNSEVGIFFHEQKLVAELSEIFERWKKKAKEFEPRNYKMRPIDYVVFALTKILHPIL